MGPLGRPRQAREHPDGIVDLSVGTPVDPTPEVVQAALRAAADSPGYPMTAGSPALREAMACWLAAGRRAVDPADRGAAHHRLQGAGGPVAALLGARRRSAPGAGLSDL